MASFTTALSASRICPLSEEERSTTGFTHKFTILYSDVAIASASGATDDVTVSFGSTPAKWLVDKALANVKTAFAGTTALTVEVGTTSSVAAFVSSTSVLTAGAIKMVSTVPVLTNATATAAVTLQAKFTNATGGSPSALTAGQLDVYLRLLDADKLP